MKLLTQKNRKELPLLDVGRPSEVAFVKLFTPDSNWTWYISEYSPTSGECFGLVDGFERELGYFNLRELESIKGPLGLKIERDRYFEPRKLMLIKADLDQVN